MAADTGAGDLKAPLISDTHLKQAKDGQYQTANETDETNRNSIAMSATTMSSTSRLITEDSDEINKMLRKSRKSVKYAKLNMTFYLMQVVIGIAEIVVAALWFHIIGMIFGVLSLFVGCSGYFIVKHHVFSPKTMRNECIRMTLRSLWEVGRIALTIVTVGFFLVHMVALDSDVRTIPAQCKGGEASRNCARVTTADPMHNRGLSPFTAVASFEEIRDATATFADAQILRHPLRTDEAFLHYRIISGFFGFPDDFYTSLDCSNDTLPQVIVNVQSQARLGIGDGGDNFQHISQYFEFLDKQSFEGPCELPSD